MNLEILSKLNPVAIVIIGVVLTLLIVSIVINLRTKSKYKQIMNDLENERHRESEKFTLPLLNNIVQDYKNAARKVFTQVNTQVIIERNFNKQLNGLYTAERFSKSAVSLMIILGLLGTFYGLTLSIGRLVTLLSSGDSVVVSGGIDSILSGLINSVEGMSVAFITSLFGIASSVIMTIFNIRINIEESREILMVEIEEYLDNYVLFKFKRDEYKEEESDMKMMRDSFDNFSTSIDSNIKNLMNILDKRLDNASKSIEASAKSLEDVIDSFKDSTDKFNANTSDLMEFNHHLKTNIERMNVHMSDFSDSMKSRIKEIENTKNN
ncbi:MAG: hypothetical protein N4A54_10945 [Peptostreptococcaceae bacterium]|nr:hypothetical protein [Peptostreptococcaceae bacterium]